MIDAPDVIRPAPSHTRNVTFSTLRPIKMGESIKTTGIVKPLKPITIPMGAKSIATQRDNVPKPSTELIWCIHGKCLKDMDDGIY